MFASRNNHAFRVHQHQPDKENMIAQTPLRPGGMPFKTPMTQRTLQPSTSKTMFGTVGPKRMQASGKDGSKTELRPRVGPSLIREASNVGEGASPFAGKGKGKGVELGKSQQLGGKDGGSNLDTNLGKSIVLLHAFSQTSKDPSSNPLSDRALSRLIAPKRLFTSTKTPLKQTAPPSSFQNPLPPVSSTPLPSASRSRRRSRQSLNQSQSQSPSNDKNTLLKTPGPARLNLESDKFKTPCRPSSSFHNAYSLYSPGDQDLLEDEEEDDEDEDRDTPAKGGKGSSAGGLSLRQELVARSGGVDLGTDLGMDLGMGMGMEMMQLNVQEVQEEEDEIEYMPPRAQALPDEPPFDYTPLETIGRSLLGAIKGDYLLPHPGDEEEDFDGFVNGQKWDILDLDLGDELLGGVADQKEQGSEEEGEEVAGRKLSANGMRMIEEEQPFLAKVEAIRKRQERRVAREKDLATKDVTRNEIEIDIKDNSGQASSKGSPAKTISRPGTASAAGGRPVGRVPQTIRKTMPTPTANRPRSATQTTTFSKATLAAGRKPIPTSRSGLSATPGNTTASRSTTAARTATTTALRPTSSMTTITTKSTTARPTGRLPLRTLSKTNISTAPNVSSTLASKTRIKSGIIERSKPAPATTSNVPKSEVFDVLDLELEMPDEGGLTELIL